MAKARGFFRNAMDALMEARMRQANAYVSQALLSLDDNTLQACGYSRKDLRRYGR